MKFAYRTGTRAPKHPKVFAPYLNLDVREHGLRGLNPFFSGLAVGMMATLLGVVLGLCVWGS